MRAPHGWLSRRLKEAYSGLPKEAMNALRDHGVVDEDLDLTLEGRRLLSRYARRLIGNDG